MGSTDSVVPVLGRVSAERDWEEGDLVSGSENNRRSCFHYIYAMHLHLMKCLTKLESDSIFVDVFIDWMLSKKN